MQIINATNFQTGKTTKKKFQKNFKLQSVVVKFELSYYLFIYFIMQNMLSFSKSPFRLCNDFWAASLFHAQFNILIQYFLVFFFIFFYFFYFFLFLIFSQFNIFLYFTRTVVYFYHLFVVSVLPNKVIVNKPEIIPI